MSKLSPSLKALIHAPFARPGPIPAPRNIDALYRQIQEEAKARQVSLRSWLAISAAATITLNALDSLVALYHFSSSSSSASSNQPPKNPTDPTSTAIQTAAYLREASLKCLSFNGLPRTINSLTQLHAALPAPIASALAQQPATRLLPSSPLSTSTTADRGAALWSSIYAPYASKLTAKLGAAHPDLPGHILHCHYGALLADPPSPTPEPPGSGGMRWERLGRVRTSLLAIACLRAQTGVAPQLLSHVYGLRKAVEDGSWREEERGEKEGGVTEEEARWLASDDGGVWVLGVVDAIVEAHGGSSFAPVVGGGREVKL